MHEAGAVAGAIARVIDSWPAEQRSGRLDLRIRDATRAQADAVGFYAAAILAERGLADVAVQVRTDAIRCALCHATVLPMVAHPCCDDCGAPLPSQTGPAVVCTDAADPDPETGRCA